MMNSNQLYFNEISNFAQLTPEEEYDLGIKSFNGDRIARNQLVESNLKLVISVIKPYLNQGLSFMELCQEGNLGLIYAAERFNPYLGNKFSTFAAWHIRQYAVRAITNKSRTVRIPAHIVEKISKLKRIEKELTLTLGRIPTNLELANKMGNKVSEIKELKKYMQETISLDIKVGDDDDATIGSLIEDINSIDPAKSFEKKNQLNTLISIIDTLPTREATILKLRFGIGTDKPMTLDEVGSAISLSRERVRQLEAKALKKLRNPMRANVLKECY